MNRLSLLVCLILTSTQFCSVVSASNSPNDEYRAAQKKALSQYAADKKLCAEESTSSSRMQCLRDARSEYTGALASAKQKLETTSIGKTQALVCADCGRVVAVTTGTKDGEGGAVGLIGGGVAGALLGHQIGGGLGKDVATIAGAAGGAYAGKKVEEKMRSSKFWSVRVLLDHGGERTLEFDHDPGVASGDLVKISGNSLTRR